MMKKVLLFALVIFGPDVIWLSSIAVAYYAHAPIACVVVSLLGVELCP